MALIILEGLDRTGKSTVAAQYRERGYEVLHMSAPPKELREPGYTGPSYLDQMVELIQIATTRNILFDRSHYGETIWPYVYGRQPHLDESDLEILRELEEAVGVERILMHDPNVEAHWQRCVDNKEPLTKGQFLKARQLYDQMAEKYGFQKRTLSDFVSTKPSQDKPVNVTAPAGDTKPNRVPDGTSSTGPGTGERSTRGMSPEQRKLEKANAINDVLSKRIIRAKGDMFDELESDIRDFLNDRLGRIFGETPKSDFTDDEIKYLKLIAQQIKAKEKK